MSDLRNSNKRVLFEFLTEAVLPLMTADGFWMAPSIAPLTSDEVTPVFKEVMNHKSYKNQTLKMATEDGWWLKAKGGLVMKEEL